MVVCNQEFTLEGSLKKREAICNLLTQLKDDVLAEARRVEPTTEINIKRANFLSLNYVFKVNKIPHHISKRLIYYFIKLAKQNNLKLIKIICEEEGKYGKEKCTYNL